MEPHVRELLRQNVYTLTYLDICLLRPLSEHDARNASNSSLLNLVLRR